MTEKLDVLQRDALVRDMARRYEMRDRSMAESWLDEALRRLKTSKKRISKAAIFRMCDIWDRERTDRCELAYAASFGW